MCGIAGIVSLTGVRRLDPDTLARMIAVQRHRGPDESGIYIDDHAGLAQTRLSIIDLKSGTQPIGNEDGSLWIVYNGEVYNYPELREELRGKGHTFSTNCDTEVILHLYEQEGAACLERLNGQFAVAIWNRCTQELFLARDRIGIRPLHVAIHDNRLYFSSEIKGVFAAGVPREISTDALDQVFTLWTTLPAETAFTGVTEVQPGHYWLVSHKGVTTERFWRIPYYTKQERSKETPDVLAHRVRELLVDATRIRLRADVPVGAYLSGGLDSSGLSACVVTHFDKDVSTFGIRFQERAFDEGTYQQEMVAALGAGHKEITASNTDIAGAFREVIWHTEKPLLRTAPVPLYLLSRLVHMSGLKVVLTGEGADEFFGGYNIFREALARAFIARQPESDRRRVLLQTLHPHIFTNSAAQKMAMHFFMQGIHDTQDPLYSHRLRWKNTAKTKGFFSDRTREKLTDSDCVRAFDAALPPHFNERDILSRAQYLEQSLFLSNYLLSSQGDRVAMAHSLEIRLPYLDHRLMDLAATIPTVWKVLGMNEKHILKKAFSGLVPDTVTKRSKHPYRAPIQQTFTALDKGSYIDDMLSEAYLSHTGIFNPGRVSLLWKKAREGKSTSEVEGMALAGIISTQVLYHYFIDGFDAHHRAHSVNLDRFIDKRQETAA